MTQRSTCRLRPRTQLASRPGRIEGTVHQAQHASPSWPGDEQQAYFYDGRTIRETCSLEEEQISVE